MKRIFAVAFMVQLWTGWDHLLAQPTADSVSSEDVQRFPNHFFLGPVIKRKDQFFKFSGNDRDLSYRYNPSNTFSIGLAANMFNVGFEILVGTRQSDGNIDRYGETKSFDMQSVVLGRRWLHDIYFQRYESFFVTYPGQEVAKGAPFPQRPDVLTRNFGYTATHFFNPKFSLRAAYSATERQLHSRGSLAVSVGASSAFIGGSEAIVPDSSWWRMGAGADAVEYASASLGFMVGYTYSLVFRHFFVNALGGLGPAHHWTQYVTEASGRHYGISINSNYYLRASVGYNGNRFFAAFNFVRQGRTVKFEDVTVESALEMYRFVLGFRFVEKGFLTKNAWDYAPKPHLN